MGNAVGGDFVVVSPVFMGLQKITVLENHAKKSPFFNSYCLIIVVLSSHEKRGFDRTSIGIGVLIISIGIRHEQLTKILVIEQFGNSVIKGQVDNLWSFANWHIRLGIRTGTIRQFASIGITIRSIRTSWIIFGQSHTNPKSQNYPQELHD